MKLPTNIDHSVGQCSSDKHIILGKAAKTAYNSAFLKLSQTAYRILKCLWREMHCCSVTVFLTSPFYSWLLRFAAPSAPEFFGGLWPLQWRYSGTLLTEIQARGRQGGECILQGCVITCHPYCFFCGAGFRGSWPAVLPPKKLFYLFTQLQATPYCYWWRICCLTMTLLYNWVSVWIVYFIPVTSMPITHGKQKFSVRKVLSLALMLLQKSNSEIALACFKGPILKHCFTSLFDRLTW